MLIALCCLGNATASACGSQRALICNTGVYATSTCIYVCMYFRSLQVRFVQLCANFCGFDAIFISLFFMLILFAVALIFFSRACVCVYVCDFLQCSSGWDAQRSISCIYFIFSTTPLYINCFLSCILDCKAIKV